MGTPAIQTNFGAGEFSPSLYSRTDLQKYHSGARKLRNFFVEYRGGASNRPGQEFLGYCLHGELDNRLIPFIFSTVQAYVLVMSDFAMRVIRDGGLVTEPPVALTGASQTNPAVLNVVNAWAAGDWIFVDGVVGMTELNNRFFLVTNPTGATVELRDLNGLPVNAAAYHAYISGGTVAKIYTVTTPWAAADLFRLKFAQSADVMTVCHPNYAPQEITRTGHAAWTVTPISFVSTVPAPTVPVAVPNTVGGTSYVYKITAVAANGRTESLPSVSATAASATMSSTPAAHVDVSWVAVAGALFYNIYRQPEIPGGIPQAGQSFGYVGTSTTLGFTDFNIAPDYTRTPPTSQNPFAAGNNPGCVTYNSQRLVFAGSTSLPQTFNMSKVGDFHNYSSSIPTRADDAINATLVSTQVNAIKHLISMQSLIALTSNGAWKIDGGTADDPVTPTTVKARPQIYNGCSDVPPIPVANEILYVQSKGSIVRNLSYNFVPNVYQGNDLTTLANHLFSGHSIVDWAYAEEPNKMVWSVRNDGTLLSLTYVKDQEIYAWAHHDCYGKYKSVASIPEGDEDAVYFIVERIMLGYKVKSLERQASRQMSAVPEKDVPADLSKAFFVDAGLQTSLVYPAATLTPLAADATYSVVGAIVVNPGENYDPFALPSVRIDDDTGIGAAISVTVGGANVITGANVVSGGTNYKSPIVTVVDTVGFGGVVAAQLSRDVVVQADLPIFTPGDVGKFLRANNGWGIVRQYNSPYEIVIDIQRAFTDTYPAAPGEWSLTPMVTTLSGLDHLEGMAVSVLADGNNIPNITVHNRSITLPQSASKIVVGLPYTSDLESLDMDFQGEVNTMQGRRKKISACTARVQDSRGLALGYDFDHLREIKERNTQPMGTQILPITGDERIEFDPAYNTGGRVCARQVYPLPATILGIIPEITMGDQ